MGEGAVGALKPLVVGELNPYGTDPKYALYPHPPRSAGARLRETLDMSLREYVNGLDRRNLCVGKWSAKVARKHATNILRECCQDAPLVMLGRKVAVAFGASDWRFFEQGILPNWDANGRRNDAWALLLPHPSGRCREWNAKGARERALKSFRELLESFPRP